MEWLNEVPRDRGAVTLTIRRTPTSGVLGGIILSERILGGKTHYTGRRTASCNGAACKWCERGLANRYHAWLHILQPATNEQGILEMTRAPAEKLQLLQKTRRSLRGIFFKSWRESKKINGKVTVTLEEGKGTQLHLPPEIDLQPTLLRIWGEVSPLIEGQEEPRRPRTIKHPLTNGNINGIPAPESVEFPWTEQSR